MNTPVKLFLCIILLCAVSFSFSATIYVDDNAPSDPASGDPTVSDSLEDGTEAHPFDAIQKAINMADPNDVILVIDGTYTGDGNRDIDFLGKAITVKSQNGPETCIIDCQGTLDHPHRGFVFQNGEAHDSILSGFTIINGCAPSKEITDKYGTYLVSESGGGIFCVNSGPLIRNCRLIDNTAYRDFTIQGITNSSGSGGGIAFKYSDAILEHCIIKKCLTSGGSTIALYNSMIDISNCLFVENSVRMNGGLLNYGTVVALFESECNITHSTFADNISLDAYDIYVTAIECLSQSILNVTNSILWQNNSVFDMHGDSLISITYSDVKGGYDGQGNIDQDPLFVKPGDWLMSDPDYGEDFIWYPGSDYRLKNQTWGYVSGTGWTYITENPCVDSADPAATFVDHDLDNNVRPIDGNQDGQAVSDMGAYEFDPASVSTIIATDSLKLQAREDYKTPLHGRPPAAWFDIRKGRTESLHWEIVNVSDDWISVGPESGVSVSDANTVCVFAAIEGLDVGIHTGSFEIVDTLNPDQRKTVTVVLDLRSSELRVPEHYDTIQQAVNWAYPGETVIVSDGVYTGGGNVNIEIPHNMDLTIKSENGPEHCVIDCQGDYDNYTKAFILDFESYSSNGNYLISGFKIVNGFTDYSNAGSAIFCEWASPTIENCIFQNCISQYKGGAIACYESSPIIDHCVFKRCFAYQGGGAIACDSSNPIIRNSIFRNNISQSEGSAISAYQSSSIMDHCQFIQNGTLNYGDYSAAVYQLYSDSVISNCLFEGNRGANGGALNYVIGYSEHIEINHSTFVGNRCDSENNSSFAYVITGDNPIMNTSYITDCVFWDNYNANGLDTFDGNGYYRYYNFVAENICQFNYSCIQGLDEALPGVGNIDVDPRFVREGYWDPNGTPDYEYDDFWVAGDYHLRPGSPCIDAGTTVEGIAVDLDGVVIPQDGDLDGESVPDIGVYEYVQSVEPVVEIIEGHITFYVMEEQTEPVSQQIELGNWGLNPLTWSAGSDAAWLTISPSSGVLDGLDSTDITLTVDHVSSLSAGTYTAQITIRDQHSASQEAIGIKLVVYELLKVPSEYPTIQDAINAAHAGDMVLVADGTYTGDGNRDINFPGKAITVKSENGPDNCIIDCQGTAEDPHRGFIFQSGKSHDSVLSGFTIINGVSRLETLESDMGYFGSRFGSAIFCNHVSPTIMNCIIRNCNSTSNAAIDCFWSSPVIENVIFVENRSHCIISHYGSAPVIRSCQFINNNCTQISCVMLDQEDIYEFVGTGAVSIFGSEGVVDNCIFSGNKGGFAAGIGFIEGRADISHCTFAGNRGVEKGALYFLTMKDIVPQERTKINHCIFKDNDCENGTDILNGRGVYFGDGLEPTFSILYEVNYSCVEKLAEYLPGFGNIDMDPLFVEPGYWDPNGTVDYKDDDFWVAGDYHLSSTGWRWDTAGEQWTWDEVTSPCIDAGNPGAALGDEPVWVDVDPLGRWGQNVRVNMGAYGGTAEASMAPLDWALLCDLDNDGRVNMDDLIPMTEMWLQSGQDQPADVSRNGTVDLEDAALFAGQWFDWNWRSIAIPTTPDDPPPGGGIFEELGVK